MKFSRCSDNGTKIEIEVADHSTIDEVLDEFQNFLRGCGYVIADKQCLTVVDTDRTKPCQDWQLFPSVDRAIQYAREKL
jgi:hypothetical protein